MLRIVRRKIEGLPYGALIGRIFMKKGIDASRVFKEHLTYIVIGRKTLEKMMLRPLLEGWIKSRDEIVKIGHGDDERAEELLKESGGGDVDCRDVDGGGDLGGGGGDMDGREGMGGEGVGGGGDLGDGGSGGGGASHIASGAVYNITTSEPLFPNQTLVSSGQIFELGFFRPNGSENQYVGIWYKTLAPSKIVWVANRELPLVYTDRSAKLTIGSDGNLKLMDGQLSVVWSTNVSGQFNSTSATLLDTGNLVLHGANYRELWGSFEDPTDTLLPSKIGVNARTGEKHNLISWTSDSDPSPGSFSTGMTSETPPQAFTWNGSTPYWRGGQWDKWKFIGIQNMGQSYWSAINVQRDPQQETTYLSIDTYSYTKNGSTPLFLYLFVSPGGSIKLMYWGEEAKAWLTYWAGPNNTCEIYGTCGPFGVCNPMNLPICRCLDGFVPKSNKEWNGGNWTGGCVRETGLNCQKNTSTSALTFVKKDTFRQMSRMKLPDSEDYLSDIRDQEGCESWCLSNCSCLAYSFVSTIGCMVWTEEDLIDIEEFSTDGEDLFVRVAHVKTGGSSQKAVLIGLSTVAGTMFFAVFVFGLCKGRAKKRGNALKEQLKLDDSLELTFFSFDSILLATNKFSTANKLGHGGFGSVYKGKLSDGKEVAVKRLSSTSAQGDEEFKNEIILISKLRHRNLVKLMGYCTEGEEKILVYEYLSNKSLDNFLFDSKKKAELNWCNRFQIIQGIARGLLYLHRDSCRRVIHRDLKVSNILLDEKMNPKISDFGLARMFEGTQVLVNTHKIVGTLGYMSPEYTMGGIFSERSDVYSFGVLLLEIAWQLWSEGKALDLMDEAIAVSFPLEVKKCVQVGLLCVQDHALDRPNMTNVVLMLSGESDLPHPRQPIFSFQTEKPNHAIPSQQESIWSVNTVTNTMVEGRASHIASSAVYQITTWEPLFPNQTLVSSSQIFELGFFTPNGSENQYVGIWYKNFTPSKIVWVANRDLPLVYTDRYAKLTIGSDGNLNLMDGQQNMVWSTNISSRSHWTSEALLDSGKFILQDANSKIWESFENPTDTLLPSMKMGVNVRTGAQKYLVSWRSDSDPSPGSFSTGMTWEMPPQPFTWNGLIPYWRGGCLDGFVPKSTEEWNSGNWTGGCLYRVHGRLAQKVIIGLSTIAGTVFFAVSVSGLCKWRAKKRGNLRKIPRPRDLVDTPEKLGELLLGNSWKEQLKQDGSLELTLFSFDSILLATNKFSTTNKLGQGGFGSVFKGKLNDGKEVAMKRLSSTSAQGIEEFENEIILISKLQHRNLVKLMDYCIEREEKILVYKYLSNKRLDNFLFDSIKKAELDWGKRFQIIQGIARGFLYLHQDSYLRVIHRDLKVSNILLDEKMNPKISDFGLARMLEGTQVLVNTQKIVGTLGYMSPEYAMGGLFSEKSDVYSFGVLLLEIVSSKKNRVLYDQEQHLNLLSYAWQLWSDGKPLDLKDEEMAVSSPLEVTRCIHVGLLCVQDHAIDRPNMSNVILMPSGESDLPQPRQPKFTLKNRNARSCYSITASKHLVCQHCHKYNG
ncbi:G-type lectin S-receptor-like serine/threonine-protein kinase At1g61370 [Rhodamnia argentea]|uniref:G-type lectin S-receptor-like serine/threonine-protein kinase At1g61370 n=1 Tax=Rhodamnia argentea TaxID=178133 RepID=A0ABM3H462_9MYRT|nr:G-type lectin S-receptor-like serine/threonine-protein kinase At1g61370 [Rhodamnia argentea]